MSKRFVISRTLLFVMLICSPILCAQSAAPSQSGGGPQEDWWANHDKWNTPIPDKPVFAGKKSGPAPRRDLSGTWDGVAEGGTQPKGAKDYPDDASHRPEPPYTPLGKEGARAQQAGRGRRTDSLSGWRTIQCILVSPWASQESTSFTKGDDARSDTGIMSFG